MAWPRWAIALTEAIHRARPQGIKGPTIFRHHAAVAVAQDAVGTAGNPVTGLAVEGGQLVVTFEDGSTDELDLPASAGDGTDQVARDPATAAQTEIDTHEASTHNTDITAQTTANTVRTELTAHEGAPHGGGVDQTARDAATAAQVGVDAHKASTPTTPTHGNGGARGLRGDRGERIRGL